MQTSYLFYDIETSGLNKCFDQILQFAAIRTDSQLREIDRYQIAVCLNPDTIIAPGALITHRLPLHRLREGTDEYTALQHIHQLLNEPGTISLGYNTLKFDDEFLRFSFYRNLLAPYTHQYANGCRRMDLYPMLVMYYLYKPEILSWPMLDDTVSLRLEALNQTNQWVAGRAHDAMVDVEITLALARVLYQQSEMWDYVTGFFDKQQDSKRYQQLTDTPLGKQGLLIMPSMGTARAYQAPVLALGQHVHYKNQFIWLHLDTVQLQDSTCQAFVGTTTVTQKKAAELGFLLPYRPRFLQHLLSPRQTLAQQNLQWLLQQPREWAAIQNYYLNYTYPKIPNLDVSAALYEQGFWSVSEQAWITRFQQQTWAQRVVLLESAATPRLYDLALRIIGRSQVDLLQGQHASTFAAYLRDLHSEDSNTLDYRGQPRLTPQAATCEIQNLLAAATLDAEQVLLLHELAQALQGYTASK